VNEDAQLRNQSFIRGYWHGRAFAERDHSESERGGHGISFAMLVADVRLREIIAADLLQADFGHPSIFRAHV
jgi:hypothetical protein